ncbi:MAG: hypothetical protein ACLSHO_08655 [Dysosmobacter sp.]
MGELSRRTGKKLDALMLAVSGEEAMEDLAGHGAGHDWRLSKLTAEFCRSLPSGKAADELLLISQIRSIWRCGCW